MKNPIKDSQVQLIGAGVIIVAAVILGLTNFRLPAPANTNLTNTTNTQAPNPININQAKSTMGYTFPGKLPDQEIQHKQVRLTTTKGDIVIELLPDQAPLAVSNFIYLVQQKFYDGIIWHRVEPGFVIQAGDPQTKDASISSERWGTGGPGYQFPDEPVTGDYTTGTVAMANAGPNTNGSQFFIMLADRDLPKAYTIFGRVTAGQDVVQSIAVGDVIQQATIESQPQ